MNPADILKYVADGGVIGLLVFILVSGYKGLWVFGSQLRESELRSLEWKTMALRNIEANDRALQVAQQMQGIVDMAQRQAQQPTPAPRRRRTTR